MIDANRFDEMAYALVYGNLEKKDLPFAVVEEWINYVVNGAKNKTVPFIMDVLGEFGEPNDPA